MEGTEGQKTGDPGTTAVQRTVVTRPDYVPEKFWKEGKPDIEGLGKSYTDLAQRFGKGKEALIPEIKADLDRERFKSRPESPDKYEIKPPEKLPEGLVFLDKPPGDDFQQEDGKAYFVADPKDPLLGWWKKTAFDAGLGQDGFMAGVMAFAEREIGRAPSPDALRAERAAVMEKLGENGKARVEHVFTAVKGMAGDKAKALLDAVPFSAEAIEALEAVIEKAGGQKFAPNGGVVPKSGLTEQQVREIISSPDYWQNPDKQAQVRKHYESQAA